MNEDKYIKLISKLVSKEINLLEFKQQTDNQSQYLWGLIEAVLNEAISVREFKKLYDQSVLNIISGLIDEVEEDFFEKVRQKLEWTDEYPDAKSKKYGWISDEEFITWLKQEKRDYQDSQKDGV